MNKKIILNFMACILSVCYIFFCSITSHADIISSDFGHQVVHGVSYSSFDTGMVSDWISGGLNGQPGSCENQSVDEISVNTGFVSIAGVPADALPAIIAYQSSAYFVCVKDESNVCFNVLYHDAYGNAPTSGYPKVTYWLNGTQNYNTILLSSNGSSNGAQVYSAQVALPLGVYCYSISAKNDSYPTEYTLSGSSFVVSSRPNNVINTSAATSLATVTNGRVTLSWNADNPDGGALTYKLYVGKDISSISLVYEGTDKSYTVNSLDYGSQYVWQVEAINEFGVSAKSSVQHFSTLGATPKAFNYPNPFNPATGQNTHIVFNMQSSGNAEVTVYSELGDRIWRRSFGGLNPGNNEVTYDGNDGNGRQLYNGTYVCIIRKNYDNGSGVTDHCRLMIIK